MNLGKDQRIEPVPMGSGNKLTKCKCFARFRLAVLRPATPMVEVRAVSLMLVDANNWLALILVDTDSG